MALANLKVNRMCAFCKHWYDPTNETIQPKAPAIGVWEYDAKACRKCIVKGLNMPARASCSKYEIKV
ncbi:MAG: hypothetical protein IJZ44_02175 [Lachnospiraceae bacterium]|nr:hypothetical protein [Lachnospiraceae bacterium]